MNWSKEAKAFVWIAAIFAACYYLPLSDTFPGKGLDRFDNAVLEALALTKWYAREHVLLCLVPAFFIAGAVGVFVGRESVMRYLGPKANKILAYAVASVAGTLLAVCSCTVLPLFAGIYMMGAGIGPATAFLYSGPAVSVLAIALTANVLGPEMGLARGVGAVAFGIVVGIAMQCVFRSDDEAERPVPARTEEAPGRPLWRTALFFASLVAVLVFANWQKPDAAAGLTHLIWSGKWALTGLSAVLLGFCLLRWFGADWRRLAAAAGITAAAGCLAGATAAFVAGSAGLAWVAASEKGELRDWMEQSWGFTRQILPLLLAGVLVAGLLLGRAGHEGLIPARWIARLLGGNSLATNALASVAGAFMYFATLTEVPIIQGLMGNGMGRGPALTLLLAGPALSLPSLLVMQKIMGLKKTLVFLALIVILSMFGGYLFGLAVG